MNKAIKAWLEHMRVTYGGYIRMKLEDWLVGILAILGILILTAPLYSLMRAWWRLWVG